MSVGGLLEELSGVRPGSAVSGVTELELLLMSKSQVSLLPFIHGGKFQPGINVASQSRIPNPYPLGVPLVRRSHDPLCWGGEASWLLFCSKPSAYCCSSCSVLDLFFGLPICFCGEYTQAMFSRTHLAQDGRSPVHFSFFVPSLWC